MWRWRMSQRTWKTVVVVMLVVVVNLICLSQVWNPTKALSPLPSAARKLSQDANSTPTVLPQHQAVIDPVTSQLTSETTAPPSGQTEDLKTAELMLMSDKNFTDLMDQRNSKIKRQCRLTSTVKCGAMSANILMLPEKDFVYCPVFKAGSTLWLTKLVKLSGKSLDQRYANKGYLDKARAVSIRGTNYVKLSKIMNSPSKTSLIIVRHPFERIVAAFRDKLERTHGDNKFYYNKYGSKIVSKQREKARRKFGREHFDRDHNFGATLPVIPDRSRVRDTESLPIFWEFVQYLLSTSPAFFDEHWRPITRHCCLCQGVIDYNNVIKLEHFNTEERAFLEHKRWSDTLTTKDLEQNVNQKHNLTSEQVTELYFRDVSDADVKRLYNIYKADFELFGYTFRRGDLVLPQTYAATRNIVP